MQTQLGLAAELAARAERSGPITIGLAGAGQMGTDIVVEVALMPGVRIGAISEIRTEAAREAALLAGHAADDIVNASSAGDIDRAIEANKLAITDDINALCAAGRIDVVIDATGNPNIGTLFALEAMKNGKHVVMLNVEADITVGRFLKEEARKAGVVYTGAAGDEPACTLELITFAQSLGFEIVAAGKGKNNPLKFDAMPVDYEEEARQRNMNARMLVEFVDGSKTMVEMAAIANATGLVPDKPGMHGPSATLSELNKTLIPQKDGGVLSRVGVVDYSIGKGVAPGIFVIADMSHPRIRERMEDLKMGHGPYFTFHRPYHLTSLEVPLTCARVVLYGKADMVPLAKPVAEVCAVAKKDLKPGDKLDAIGEYTYRAWIMRAEEAREAKAVPCGLLQGGEVLKPIRKGELLTYDNATPPAGSKIAELRARQDRLVFGTQGA